MLNKVTLIGRLGQEPTMRYMPNGDVVCNFSVATDESRKDANGQKQTRTEWHNITLYRKLAEIAGQYLKKGGLVYLEGKIQSRKYTGKDGIERTAYDIIGSEMKMLGTKNDQSNGQYSQQDSGDIGQQASPPPAPRRQETRPTSPPVSDIDSDIPF